MTPFKIHRNTFAKVNLNNLRHNVQAFMSVSDGQFFCPMIKSNAYGHGVREVMSVLNDLKVKDVGVALVEEALQIRALGFNDVNVLIFGAIKPQAFEVIIENHLTPVITNWSELTSFAQLKINSYPVHIKFNTGMNRFGFSVEDAEKVKQFIEDQSTLQLRGVCSHFYDGENIAELNQSTQQQMLRFEKVLQHFEGCTAHIYNSSSFLNKTRFIKEPFSMGSRLGLAIYGSYPNSDYKTQNYIGLKPVMSLHSEVIEYQKVPVGEVVSYSGNWQAQRPSVIGVVPIGYTDGYGREFSNKGQMIFRGTFVPVVGKICMDYTMVDLTDVLGDQVGNIGEEIVLFGKQGDLFFGVEEFAEQVGKIPYEVLTTIGRRVPRNYIREK